ncbi:dihydroneopterin aldolase [Nitratifractor sp.]
MKIEIRSLQIDAIIGILPEEREAPQRIVADLRAEYRYEAGDYLDYAAVAETIRGHLVKEKFGLLEEALLSLKEKIFAEYPLIESLELRLEKPEILAHCFVAVSERWHRIDF